MEEGEFCAGPRRRFRLKRWGRAMRDVVPPARHKLSGNHLHGQRLIMISVRSQFAGFVQCYLVECSTRLPGEG